MRLARSVRETGTVAWESFADLALLADPQHFQAGRSTG
jgi:hypothetical protein